MHGLIKTKIKSPVWPTHTYKIWQHLLMPPHGVFAIMALAKPYLGLVSNWVVKCSSRQLLCMSQERKERFVLLSGFNWSILYCLLTKHFIAIFIMITTLRGNSSDNCRVVMRNHAVLELNDSWNFPHNNI